MQERRRILNDGSIEEIETFSLYGDDEIGSKTIKSRIFDKDINWTDCEANIQAPILVSQITTTEAKKNNTTGQTSFSGNTLIRCLAQSKLKNIPNRKLELSAGLISETDSKGEFLTDGNFKLTSNGDSVSFFDINDEEFLKMSSQLPALSTNIPFFRHPNAFGERIMAIDTSTPDFEMAKDLENLYKKGYPEAGLTLAHMYQQQAQQAERKGDKDTAMQAKSVANTLFQEIVKNEHIPFGLRATARGMQSGTLKGNSVKDMNFARKLASDNLVTGGLASIAATMAVSHLLPALGALSPAIGLAVGGIYLYTKYRDATPLKKAGLRTAFDSTLKGVLKDFKDFGNFIKKRSKGGR